MHELYLLYSSFLLCGTIYVRIICKNKGASMKKCCISCAFCLKRVYRKNSMHIKDTNPVQRYLTMQDVESALDGNFDFMNRERHDYDNWITEYQKRYNKKILEDRVKKEERRNRHTISVGDAFPEGYFYKMENNGYENLGLNEPPIGPVDYTELTCAEGVWQYRNVDKENFSDILVEKDCQFYYPVKLRGEKTLEVCRKERDNMKQNQYLKELKEASIINRDITNHGSGNIIINSSSPNATIVVNNDLLSVFDEIKNVINQNKEIEDKERILTLLEELKDTTNEKTSFAQKYAEFVSLMADHITILTPFIPSLTTFLS